MTRVMLLVLGALTCALVCAPVRAEDPPKKLTPEERLALEKKWQNLTRGATEQLKDGKLKEAERGYRDALEVARRLYPAADYPDGHGDLCVSLNNLGYCLKANPARLTDAEAALRDAWDMLQRLAKGKLRGEDARVGATMTDSLGQVSEARGKLPEAERYYRTTVELMLERYQKEDHAAVAYAHANLARVLRQRAKLAEAEAALRDALAVYLRLAKGQDHELLIDTWIALAEVFADREKYAEPEALCGKALAMQKRLAKGRDEEAVLARLHDLAAVYTAQRKYAEAEPLHAEALEMAKRLYKGDNPVVATLSNNFAVLLKDHGKYAEARPLFKDALDMYRRLHKGDHPSVALGLANLGAVYKAQGDLSDAASFYKDALDMYRRLYKGDHPVVALALNNLALAKAEQGQLAKAEQLHSDALAMRKRLHKGDHTDVAQSLNNLATVYQDQCKLVDAAALFKDALEMKKRLYTGDHFDVASGLNNLVLCLEGVPDRLAEAESLARDSLAMLKRLHKGDHLAVATGLTTLAGVYETQGKLAEAEPLCKAALEMRKRLYTGDHAEVAKGLNNLASVYLSQGKLAEAEPLFKAALEMKKRMFKGDHPDVALALGNLAHLYFKLDELARAEPLIRDALAMRKRVYAGDHTDVAVSLTTLAGVHLSQGKLVEAEALFKDALEMKKRLYTGDHADVARGLHNLGAVSEIRGKPDEAEPLLKEALQMAARLTVAYARQKSEGDALTFSTAQPLTRDVFLSHARRRAAAATAFDPGAVYRVVWAGKGMVARVFEQRQLQVRATAEPAATKMLDGLAGARRRRAELLLAPVTKDPDTLQKREEDLATLDRDIARLNEALPKLLPALARGNKLAAADVADLQQALPADTVVVDYLRYWLSDWDNDLPAGEKETYTLRYLAFVVTKDRVALVDLDTAASIDHAIDAWRAAITSGKEIPAAVPAKARELVWDKVRKELPTGTKTVYICPDQALCRVPFAALPGDKPGTVLLEDFALATIPHAPFLLEKLWPQEPLKNPPTGALVVGGVEYDAELAAPVANVCANRGDPLVKPGAKPGWSFLANTVGEANGVAIAAASKKIPVARLDGERATTSAVLSALSGAKMAHFATHGFFADPSFRSAFQLDEKDYKQSLRGERIGRAANSPLVMTGLVLAGANNPKTPGRGIVTGEQLIDLDLSGLELAVLSACETGIGDVAGGEGTFGLQRAFHYAGTTNVIASLWKVPDAPTAALMALFYTNLWDKNLPPMEALRQAQLEIYRNPGKIAELAKGFRGKFEEVAGAGGEVEIKPGKDGTAHPLLWAAFTLSGPGPLTAVVAPRR